MLDFLATVTITAVMVVVVNAVIGALQITRIQRIVLAIVVGLWIGLVAATTSIGWIGLDRPFPVIGLFFAVPLIAAGLLAAFWPGVRATLLALPTPLLVGLNVARPVGGIFLLLAAQGRSTDHSRCRPGGATSSPASWRFPSWSWSRAAGRSRRRSRPGGMRSARSIWWPRLRSA